MIEQEIIENNRLIDEFLGWKIVDLNPILEDEDDFHIYEFRQYDYWGKVIDSIGTCDISKDSVHPYNTDWNWLKTALNRILDIDNEKDIELARIMDENQSKLNILTTSILCPIDGVYERVIDFIKFYNEYNNG
jgi:hypothetical protein